MRIAEPALREAAGWIHAAGGLYASASDLARWDLALVDGKVLKPESYQLMTTPRPLSGGKTAFDSIPAEAKGHGRELRAAQPGLWRQNLTSAEQQVMAEVMGGKLAELGYS